MFLTTGKEITNKQFLECEQYIKRIRNKNKQGYAVLYLNAWLNEKPLPCSTTYRQKTLLSLMAADAVEREINLLLHI